MSENQRFSDVFRRYCNRALGYNGLIIYSNKAFLNKILNYEMSNYAEKKSEVKIPFLSEIRFFEHS